MNTKIVSTLPVIILVGLITGSAISAENRKMPKEDVIDVPAIGEGLCVHNLFQSNMVLQRDKPLAVWGWAASGEKVTVSFAGQTQTATADKDRAWKVMLTAMPANAQAQKMTVQGKDKTLTLENILVGDVWVLGGQSNMEAPLQDVENGQLEIVSANYAGIRILTIPAQNGHEEKKGFPRLHEWSGWFSRHFRKGDWDVCSPKIARELSAIGYVFARRIHMASQIPIGVIDTSRGGTTVETWTPAPVMRTIDTKEVKDLLAEWDKKVADFDPQKDLQNRVQNYRNWAKDLEKRGEKVPADQKEESAGQLLCQHDRSHRGVCRQGCHLSPGIQQLLRMGISKRSDVLSGVWQDDHCMARGVPRSDHAVRHHFPAHGRASSDKGQLP